MAETHKLVQATEAGHTNRDNNPPADPYLAQLEEDNQALASEQAALEIAAAKLPAEVNSDDDVAAITKWVVDARSLARRVENKRVADKEPLLAKTRTLDTFFNGISNALKNRAQRIEDRSAPYLKAKRERAEAEAKARAEAAAAEARRLQDEADERRRQAEQARLDAEAEQERMRQAAAEAAAQQTTAQLLADADEGAPIQVDFAAAGEANDAEERARDAEREAARRHNEAEAADKAAADAQALADKQASQAQGGHKLSRTGGGGGSANVRQVWTARIDSWQLLGASLGPLVHYLSRTAVEAAVEKASQAQIRPEIPGVSYHSHDEVRTTASRAKS